MNENQINIENILNRIKRSLELKNDNELSEVLQLSSRSLINHWKKNNKVDYEKIILLCKNNNLDLNYIIFGVEMKNNHNPEISTFKSNNNNVENLISQVNLLKEIIINLKNNN